jgi:hypothetical protein
MTSLTVGIDLHAIASALGGEAVKIGHALSRISKARRTKAEHPAVSDRSPLSIKMAGTEGQNLIAFAKAREGAGRG